MWAWNQNDPDVLAGIDINSFGIPHEANSHATINFPFSVPGECRAGHIVAWPWERPFAGCAAQVCQHRRLHAEMRTASWPVFKWPRDERASAPFRRLHLTRARERITFELAALVFECLHGLEPTAPRCWLHHARPPSFAISYESDSSGRLSSKRWVLPVIAVRILSSLPAGNNVIADAWRVPSRNPKLVYSGSFSLPQSHINVHCVFDVRSLLHWTFQTQDNLFQRILPLVLWRKRSAKLQTPDNTPS